MRSRELCGEEQRGGAERSREEQAIFTAHCPNNRHVEAGGVLASISGGFLRPLREVGELQNFRA